MRLRVPSIPFLPSDPSIPFLPSVLLVPFLAVTLVLLTALPLRACGPVFPSSYLGTDGEATFPWIDFSAAILDAAAAHQLLPPGLPNFPPSKLCVVDADVADFAARLAEPDLARSLTAAQRDGLRARYEALAQAVRDPEHPPVTLPTDLPPQLREFVLYLEGAIWLYQHEDISEPPRAWTELLKLPPAQRRYRTTWVLYMAGILGAHSDSETAGPQAFENLRQAAAAGFHDTLGLAYASFRREYLDAGDLPRQLGVGVRAAAFYRRFPDTGECNWIVQNLRNSTASGCLKDPAVLAAIVADPVAREAVVARFADRYHVESEQVDQLLKMLPPQPVKCAERIAFLAYIRNDLAATRAWLAFTPKDSLVGLWLAAELERRAGRYDVAAVAYRRWLRCYHELASRASAAAGSEGRAPALPTFTDGELYMYGGGGRVPAAQGIYARLGTTLVHRRDFLEALDCFLRAGAWIDAAYLADTVISTADLQAYVDAHADAEVVRLAASLKPDDTWWWLDISDDDGGTNDAVELPARTGDKVPKSRMHASRALLRYLLARRLVREDRIATAIPYLPTELQPDAKRLAAALAVAGDPAAVSETRALACYNAARILRWRGMELAGTELYPDSQFTGGGFFFGVDPSLAFRGILPRQTFHNRISGNDDVVTLLTSPPSEMMVHARDQLHAWLDRINIHPHRPGPVARRDLRQQPPVQRFHYRLWAAGLMLQAADLTADVRLKTIALYCGGCWLKARDPYTAKLFYSRLIGECASVDLGMLARRRGWLTSDCASWLDTQLTTAGPALGTLADIPATLVATPGATPAPVPPPSEEEGADVAPPDTPAAP